MNHKWDLQQREGSFKVYVCGRCGAGPVYIPDLATKGTITQTAKKQGIDANCKVEIVKKIHEL